jgi:isoleucyl-tRNA synthetase
MAEASDPRKEMTTKSPHALREERILSFWKDKDIFNKSLNKPSPKGEFVFYEGPPTANGRPGIHHLEARAFKDVIPRYRTMRGYHVRRKGGWDTHGLPVELQVEKELGLKSKKEIESYGIEKFNDKCKESVWKYVHEWEDFTNRMGYWVDLKDPYITYKPDYMESVWNVIKTADEKGLLYKDYKVVPWCPRCGTALSSHELAQGYEDVKDLSVTVEFRVKDKQNTSLLAWTTTPWTLPGNVGLAVNANITYVEIEKKDMGTGDIVHFILAKDLLGKIFAKDQFSIVKEMKGGDLIGLSYEPLYPFEKDNVSGAEKDKLTNAFKVYAADFVTTADGTGIVHIAPMYGQDDFELGNKVGLPKYHLVNEDGTFKKETGFLAGKFVKDEAVAIDIIKDLANRPTGSLLFHKEKHEHSYPFCWRCHTPLIYFARDSWYLRMSELRHKLIKENEGINWEPSYIKEGRFGEWLREVKDWAISRERYWGTPLPVWICEKCGERKVVGSVADVSKKPRNTYYVMRHGEAENNTLRILDSNSESKHHLTELGKKQAADSSAVFKGTHIDLIISSPILRTRETAEIAREKLGLKKEQLVIDERIKEYNAGIFEDKPLSELIQAYSGHDRYLWRPEGGEDYADVKKRMGSFLYDVDNRYEGKSIMIVTHETPAMLLVAAAGGLNMSQTKNIRKSGDFMKNAEIRKIDFSILPHNHEYELDLHKPYIDEVKLSCACGGEMKRVKEVMDVWFDSGSMPFAQDHYPFENKALIDGSLFKKAKGYPADFISEAIDQTRGWFYTLHAIGAIMGKGKAFKNVICLGHMRDAEGKKMSKSIGNVIDPWFIMDKYGADAVRFWMYSINAAGESKDFEEKTVDEIVKKVFNLASNVAAFYKMYEEKNPKDQKPNIKNESQNPSLESQNVLDQWIMARLNQLVENVTTNLDKYTLLEPARAIRDFIGDLSQWYLRRSRDRFKGGDSDNEKADKEAALATTKEVLLSLAQIMAPFTPFFAEELYQNVGGDKESVHLEEWPTISSKFNPPAGGQSSKLLEDMETVRTIASRGLEARMAAKINVRQPLAALRIKNDGSLRQLAEADSAGLIELIKDEVNVKEVVFNAPIETEVALDTTITPALKEEGDLRELLRKIQDLRKEKGLSVGDKASLVVPAEFKSLVDKFGAEIKKATNLTSIEVGEILNLKS